MPQYCFRDFQLGDYESAYALWSRTEGMGLGASDTREAIGFFLSHNTGLSQAAFDSQHQLVGALLCGHDGRRGYLHHLAVDRAHRLHGIGSELVNRTVEKLAALHIEKCNLFLMQENDAGLAFWQRQGWTPRRDIILVQRALRPGGQACCSRC